MQAKYISYRDTNAFSSVVLDYLDRKPELTDFYRYTPDNAGLSEAIVKRNFRGSREVLVRMLKKQYLSEREIPLAVSSNIASLADDRTFTVTTGHQLNIFTGPLYFIYKIVTAINLAAQLKREHPEYNFVPVYWMATEDHDFEEINHLQIEDRKLTWNKSQAKGATGKMGTADIEEVLTAYKGFLGIGENGLKLAEIVEKAYAFHRKLSDATRSLVNALFGKYGLVCLDADEPELKQQFAEVIFQDITGEHSFKNISRSNEALEELGYKPQVNPREINFFYMLDELRERIVREGELFKVVNTEISFTAAELREELNRHPERFSPNVVMRPLYQELVLPNLAYIGGGAEVVYWLQLKSNFEHYGVDFPVLLLRNSALVIDRRNETRMHLMGINYKDLFADVETIKNNWVKAHVPLQLALPDEQLAISWIFEQIKLSAFKIDKTLSVSADTAKTRTLKMLENLEKKMLRAEKRKHTTSLAQIEKLKERLFPGSGLQERVVNIAPMYIAYGDSFIEGLIAAFKPLDHEFTVLFA